VCISHRHNNAAFAKCAQRRRRSCTCHSPGVALKTADIGVPPDAVPPSPPPPMPCHRAVGLFVRSAARSLAQFHGPRISPPSNQSMYRALLIIMYGRLRRRTIVAKKTFVVMQSSPSSSKYNADCAAAATVRAREPGRVGRAGLSVLRKLQRIGNRRRGGDSCSRGRSKDRRRYCCCSGASTAAKRLPHVHTRRLRIGRDGDTTRRRQQQCAYTCCVRS
jgi:hypothetical protein